MTLRWFKGDRWSRLYGFVIPFGSPVLVIRFFQHRRVLINYRGQLYFSMLWCLSKTELPLRDNRPAVKSPASLS